MKLTDLSPILVCIDLVAVAVFAVTGALVASRKQMDIVGFCWLGLVTGVGGGTVRDLLIGAPVFWVRESSYVLVCIAASVAVFLTAHVPTSRYRLILWLDAIGLALVTVAGAAKGLDAGAGAANAVMMGVVTATVGGIIRDIIGQEPSIILRREIYVTASVAGGVALVALDRASIGRELALAAGFLTALVIRCLAIRYAWSLPTYRARPGRVPEE
ncbi:MAG TPA: trimeric intracellular cation channel family protein [Hyphomicrobiaceae bacterium]|nr:trimeric intracellular cation channel family protein [Hyphomicrobiaceae bacterium]